MLGRVEVDSSNKDVREFSNNQDLPSGRLRQLNNTFLGPLEPTRIKSDEVLPR